MDRAAQEGGEDDGDGGFQYVTRKNKSNRKRRKGKEELLNDDERKLIKRIDIISAQKVFLKDGAIGTSIQTLIDDTFSSTMKGNWPNSILALGLGSVKDSKAAQTQLAFLLIVRDHLQQGDSKKIKVQAYDPIFDEEDRKMLDAHDIEVSSTNLQGNYTFNHPVFIFMPHCTKTLYENILRSNWSPIGLNRLWLCCNDLERYAQNIRSSQEIIPCICRIVTRLSVHRLPSLPSSHSGALNDLAMQRYCPPSHDTIDELTDKLDNTTLHSDGRHKDGLDVTFFDLPDLPNIVEKDPELI